MMEPTELLYAGNRIRWEGISCLYAGIDRDTVCEETGLLLGETLRRVLERFIDKGEQGLFLQRLGHIAKCAVL